MAAIFWFDILVLGMAIIIFLRGISGGIARGLLDIGVLLATLYATRFFVDTFIIPAVGALPAIPEFVIFLVAWFMLYLISSFGARLLFKIVKIQFISPVEQIGGFAVAMAKVLLLLAIFQNLVSPLPGGAPLMDKSATISMVRPLQKWTRWNSEPLLPTIKSSPEVAKETVDALKKVLEKELKGVLPEIPKKL